MNKEKCLLAVKKIQTRISDQNLIKFEFLDNDMIEFTIDDIKVRIRKEIAETAREYDNVMYIYRVSLIKPDGILLYTECFNGMATFIDEIKNDNKKENEMDILFRSIFDKCREVKYNVDGLFDKLMNNLE